MFSTRSLARPLLAGIFVSGGIEALRDPRPRVEKAAPMVPRISDPLGLPADPDLLVKVNAGVQVGAGVLLAIGKVPRLAALALIGSTIPTTYVGHRFWELGDKESRTQQRVHFLKNLGLIGGLVLAAVDNGGAPSVSWRVRRHATQVSRAAGEAGRALASGGGHTVASGVGGATKVAARGARHPSTAARWGARRGSRAVAAGAHRGRAGLGHAARTVAVHLPMG